MAQLTIRGVPDDVMDWLRQRAKEEGVSVNRIVLGILCEWAGRDLQGRPLGAGKRTRDE